jgi:sugar phosphate isomerase/epimerase
MISRRQLFKTAGAAAVFAFIPEIVRSAALPSKSNFRFCLNTSTIRGQNPGLLKYIEFASRAGYDGIELWVQDVQEFRDQGNSLSSLRKKISDSGLVVENAIGFANWLVDDEQKRKEGFAQMKLDMELMAQLDCKRIAAPPAGIKVGEMPNPEIAGQRYKQLIDLGRQTGVMPQLEFWGASGTLSQLGQAMMIAASANDPDVHILADAYHMFRGQSGFEGLKMLSGNVIEIFHMNDYPDDIPREAQQDKDRVYPGDGVAPLKQILSDLANMGGTKVLSLELFNPQYWKEDPLLVSKTGLEKMKNLVAVPSTSSGTTP